MERIPKQESAQKVDPEEENSPADPAGTRTRDFSIMSTVRALITELSPPPKFSSVQFEIVLCAQKSPYALHPVSETFLQRIHGNG